MADDQSGMHHESSDYSPNAATKYSGTQECEVDGCHVLAEWDVELIDSHAQTKTIRCCDHHVEDYWGYHPEENR